MHDLVLAEVVAGRDKDVAYVTAAVQHDLVDAAKLLERIPELPLNETRRRLVERRVQAALRKTEP